MQRSEQQMQNMEPKFSLMLHSNKSNTSSFLITHLNQKMASTLLLDEIYSNASIKSDKP